MKTWIKRSLIALSCTAVLVGGLSACGHRGHSGSWTDAQVTEMRGKAVDRIGSKLDLNAEQKSKLGALADEMIAARKSVKGSTDPRADITALIATDKFDRSRAQQLLDEKTKAVQGSGPKLIAAFADFYDSLNAEQQKRVRERLAKGGGFGPGARH